MVMLDSLVPMHGSVPSTVTACSGRLEKSYQQVVTLSGLGWSETTLSTSVSAGTNLVRRQLRAWCTAGPTPGLIQLSDCGSTVNCIVRQGCAKTGGANASMIYVATSSTGVASGNGGEAVVDAVDACGQQPDLTDRCDTLARRVKPRNSGLVEQIK